VVAKAHARSLTRLGVVPKEVVHPDLLDDRGCLKPSIAGESG
jgi:hypothetical protein